MKTERITIRITPYVDLKLSEIARITGAPKSTVASAGLLRFVEDALSFIDTKSEQTDTSAFVDEPGGDILPQGEGDLP